MTRKANPVVKRAKRVVTREALKPAMIEAQFSIPPSSLHFYCTGLPETDRLPSFMLPGRTGKRDTRLVYVDDLKKWLEKYRATNAA